MTSEVGERPRLATAGYGRHGSQWVKKFCLDKRVCILEVMADLQSYRFEPERVSNPEDNESENEEVNVRLEGTFWCSSERC